MDFETPFLWRFRGPLRAILTGESSQMAKLTMLLVSFAVSAVVGTFEASEANAADAPTIEIALENNAFVPTEVTASANTPLVLKFVNKDSVPAEIESKDLNVEKVVAGKSEIIVRVKALKPGKYLFVNDYKAEVMQGHLVVN
jgi:plastocyanin